MLSRVLIAVAGVALAAVAAATIGAAAPTLEIDPALRQVLSRDLKFSPMDFSNIARGRVVRRTLETKAANELAVVGAIWVNASMDASLDAFRDIARFKKGEGILQIGRFSNPPTLEDMAGLTVDDDDLDGEGCRVGNCSVRLPARELVRFRREINWEAPDAKARAGALFKKMVFDQVRAYWSGEGERIVQYDDDKRPIRPGPEFAGILANSPYLGELAPGLPEHLRDFPESRASGDDDFLYWSKESLGIGPPFITVTHVTIRHLTSGTGVITSKDVYSSRYIDSSLGITVASGPADGEGFALVYLNRTRASALRGGFRALRRAMVERLSRGGIEDSLKKAKARLETGR